MNEYEETMVVVDIRQVGYLDEILRKVRPEQTENLKNVIREFGYLISDGKISIRSKT